MFYFQLNFTYIKQRIRIRRINRDMDSWRGKKSIRLKSSPYIKEITSDNDKDDNNNNNN